MNHTVTSPAAKVAEFSTWVETTLTRLHQQVETLQEKVRFLEEEAHMMDRPLKKAEAEQLLGRSLAWPLRYRHENGLMEAGAVLETSRCLRIIPSRWIEWERQQSERSREQPRKRRRRRPIGRGRRR